MVGFLKLLGKGILYTVTLPLILLVWLFYGTYLIFVFIYMLIKSTILFFRGIDPAGDTKEDIEARRMILEDQNEKAQMQQAMGAMFQTMSAQMQAQQFAQAQQYQQSAQVFQQPNNFIEAKDVNEIDFQQEELDDSFGGDIND